MKKFIAKIIVGFRVTRISEVGIGICSNLEVGVGNSTVYDAEVRKQQNILSWRWSQCLGRVRVWILQNFLDWSYGQIRKNLITEHESTGSLQNKCTKCLKFACLFFYNIACFSTEFFCNPITKVDFLQTQPLELDPSYRIARKFFTWDLIQGSP